MDASRMPRYTISNEGVGPYALFFCDRCQREYRSTPSIARTVQESVTRGALGGFLRNIPLVGNAAADSMSNNQYRTTMDQAELQAAWGQVQTYFRECPTCHQIVCVPDFDEQTGFCNEDSPRAAEVEAAKAQQAAAALKGVADAFGIGDRIQQSMAAAQAKGASAGSTVGAPCTSCGTPLSPGARFCPNCGTAVAQPSACASCGTVLAPGAKFCASCGTPVA